jgi:hypothetical protein
MLVSSKKGLRSGAARVSAELSRGRSRTSLIALANETLDMANGPARKHWATRFGTVEQQLCDDILADIRDLSPTTGTFVGELLAINVRRLSDVL